MATHLIFDKKYFVSFSYEERTMQRKMFKPKFSLLLSVKHDLIFEAFDCSLSGRHIIFLALKL